MNIASPTGFPVTGRVAEAPMRWNFLANSNGMASAPDAHRRTDDRSRVAAPPLRREQRAASGLSDQASVGELRPLGLPGGARRVEERGHVARLRGHGVDRLTAVELSGVAHDDGGFRVDHDMVDLVVAH